jgi:hypothetical protein
VVTGFGSSSGSRENLSTRRYQSSAYDRALALLWASTNKAHTVPYTTDRGPDHAHPWRMLWCGEKLGPAKPPTVRVLWTRR